MFTAPATVKLGYMGICYRVTGIGEMYSAKLSLGQELVLEPATKAPHYMILA